MKYLKLISLGALALFVASLAGCAGFSRTMEAVKKAVGVYDAAEKPAMELLEVIETPDAEEEE